MDGKDIKNMKNGEDFEAAYLDFLKANEPKKNFQEIAKKETTFIETLRDVLIHKYSYSENQIIVAPKMETNSMSYRPDLVVFDSEKQRRPIIIVEFKLIEKAPRSLKQLKDQMLAINVPFGILYDGKNLEFYQNINQFIMPVASIPDKKEAKKKFYQLSIDDESSKQIAAKLSEIISKHGFNEIDVVLFSLQILFIKYFDEVYNNNTNFEKDIELTNSVDILNSILRQVVDAKLRIGTNYIKGIPDDLAYDLVKLVQNLTVRNSRIIKLFEYLIETNSSPNITALRTPQHLYESMFNLLNIKKDAQIHLVIDGIGESLTTLIKILDIKEKSDLSPEIQFKTNISCSIKHKSIFEILTLLQILTNIPIKLELRDFNKEFSSVEYDYIIYDSLRLSSEHFEQRKVDFKNFHDYMMLNGLEKLRGGGRLICIVPTSYLFQRNARRDKIFESSRPLAIIELPIMGISFSTYNCAIILLEKRHRKSQSKSHEFTFMAQNSPTKRSFFNPYDQRQMDVILQNFKEFENNDELNLHEDSGFVISSDILIETNDWSVARRLPSMMEKIKEVPSPRKLKDVVQLISGRKFPLNDQKVQRKIPYILISDFEDLKQARLLPLKISTPDELRIDKKFVEFTTKEGDILLSRSGTIGKVVIVSKEYSDLPVSPGIIILRIKNRDMISPRYLEKELLAGRTQEQFNNFSRSSFNYYLTNELVGNVVINVPTIEERLKYEKRIKEIEEKIEEYNKKIDQLKRDLDILRGV